MTLRRSDFNGLVHIENAKSGEERSWHFLKVGVDTILIGNWYRPGSTVHEGFSALYNETAEYFNQVSGILLVGDLNIHHQRWLRHSNANTSIGAEMKCYCDFHGLFQIVREPTRNEYLLDLAITDMAGASAKVLPKIADHQGVLVELPIPEVIETAVTREVWKLKNAKWKELEEELQNADWEPLRHGTAEHALNYFMEILWLCLVKYIPRETVIRKHSTHPWLNARCRAAINRKNNSEGTAYFSNASDACAQVLREERSKYVAKLKEKLASLPRCSKQWWRINRELLNRKANPSAIPPLRNGTDWLLDAKAKADAFATNFAFKNQLPPEVVDTPFFSDPEIEMLDFFPLRTRLTKRLFRKLDESTATGSDKISAGILKRLSHVLAFPFTRVCRRLLYEGCWPKIWKHHLIVPIFKKGSAFVPGNYRGVHLTSVLSKVAERLIGSHLVPFLQRSSFGDDQWAFRTGVGCKDLVTMLVMSWILGICSDKKIGAYLSDITGAFDRVFKIYLLAKLHAVGVGPTYLNFLDAYLAERQGRVVVQGASSDLFTLDNQVFQGTVLGPPLWNSFFADVSVPANATGGKAAKFADDLNVFKLFDRLAPVGELMSDLAECRTRVHAWGRANRVEFDPAKEHLVVLHPSEFHGEPFKLLGLMIDLDLRMHTAIDQLLSKIRPKSTAILRTRGYYSAPELLNQYKTHIWCLVELHSGGYFHAATSLLEKVDQVQRNFLQKLEISESTAFLEFNFPPSVLRRNIGILGLLHKRVLGLSHCSFEQLLPWLSQRADADRGFGHNKQLYGHWLEATQHRALYSRSVFAMVDIYNNLPQEIVDARSVSAFQHLLTDIAKDRCRQQIPRWEFSFCRRTGPDLDGAVIQ